jgi:Na+/H+ antiporter NhaD/arsenite permease-like protein
VPAEVKQAAAAAIFVATYAVMALGRVPGLRIDRAGAALLGAALMIGVGALTLDEAYAAVDYDTLVLLLGMMVLAANLRLSGFFALVTHWVVRRARHPLLLLVGIVLAGGVLSAFLVNDTICLVLTPLVLEVVRRLRRNAVPYAIAVALCSNAGGVATMTGNPQNMIIGGLSRPSYSAFAAALAPVAVVALILVVILVAIVWRREFFSGGWVRVEAPVATVQPWLLTKSLLVTAALLVALFAGVRPAEAALLAGALLLPSRRLEVQHVYAEIDWPLLVMFAGLFIVIAGLERSLLTPQVVAMFDGLHSLPALAVVTAVLSNIVSNVPAVLVLKPLVQAMPEAQRAWLVVAMAATLAGNFSIVGSVANLIVVQRAQAAGVRIGIWRYFAVSAPLTVLSILAGLALL